MADVLASEPSDPPSTAADPGETPNGRAAGPAQAALLIGASCLSVLGVVLVAPVQPRIAEAFATTPGVDILVPLTVVMPAVLIALLSPLAGRIADRIGRVRLLTGSLIVYAIFGTLPLLLPTLELVVASRAGVGVAEAGILTCCFALMSDMWSGTARARILGYQTLVASLSAVVIVGLGGALGASGWRTPFWVYAVSLLFALAAPKLLWNPGGQPTGVLPPVRWRLLALPLVMTFLGGVIFYVPLLELSFALDGIGVTSTTTIGLVSAGAALASAITAGLFGRVSGAGPRILLPIALALAGIGVVVIGLGSTVLVIVLGAVVASAGSGLLVPTLLVWALGPLSLAERGRATGVWFTCLTTAQIACPWPYSPSVLWRVVSPERSSCSASWPSSWPSPPPGYRRHHAERAQIDPTVPLPPDPGPPAR